MTAEACEDCRAHSGVDESIKNLRERQKSMEGDLKSMRKLMITTLISALLTLLGVIGNYL